MTFSYLDPSRETVFKGLENREKPIGKGQDAYRTITGIIGRTREVPVLVRWSLTDAQREIVLNGGDVFVEVLTFGHGFPPMLVGVGDEPPVDQLKKYGFPEVVA